MLPREIADALDRNTEGRCAREDMHRITVQSRCILGSFLTVLKALGVSYIYITYE